MSITYKDSGVNIDAANAAKARMKALVERTRIPGVIGGIGAFGGLFEGAFPGMTDPVLVASADGVGTKLKIAFMTGRHDTVGVDIVCHCANDILAQGARPLFFLDYLACGRLDEETVVSVVSGVAEGCVRAGCALLGGETAEMPDFYAVGEYDLAGFIVGVVEHSRMLDSSAVQPGDVLLGLASDGLHTNGYSLARRVLLDEAGLPLESTPEGFECSLADELLRPHRCYTKPVLPLVQEKRIHAIAHITGGGLIENLPRSLPEDCGAVIDRTAWNVPPVFRLIQQKGDVPDGEMYRVFNMGIGMVLVVAPGEVDHVASSLEAEGERVIRIGLVESGPHHVVIEGV